MSQLTTKIQIHVKEKASLLEPLSVKIETGEPKTAFRMTLETKDDKGNVFISKAVFESDENGWIDVATCKPVSGDYESVDHLGMIWSMSVGKKNRMFVKHSAEAIIFDMNLYNSNGDLLANKSFERTFLEKSIIKEALQDDVVGSLFYPEDQTDLPAIIIVGGSDGAVHESAAALLASEGYAVLALAYFGKEGLPKGIEHIPLEYVDHAFSLLESRMNVNQDKLAIIGHSRGAELALLYASNHTKVKAVIASGASSVIFSGMINFQPTKKSAWTYKQVPYEFYAVEREFKDTVSFFRHLLLRKPYSGIETMKASLQDNERLALYSIPVQNIQAPIMLFAGTDDHVQPAELFLNRMKADLHNHAYSEDNQFILHSGAGHFAAFPSSLPNLPQTVEESNALMTLTFGGTKKINADVAHQSWDETVTFLHTHL
ncbi:acyl-CoA thioesterase/bile acid-CoA:amino acid N-acyltransferase family protein [Shouchella sp. JSM 1781072]|uniref:acyl-CoA thioesterase/bile acid-CoA:amino acid N-acyltransferase family protein n=1 Tax=Shouchella sp. JSM 1781072 TaxID=3344581 RepID=UPI0035C1E64B